MFAVFSIQRVKELIEGAGKQREAWEVFVPEASGFDETPPMRSRGSPRPTPNLFLLISRFIWILWFLCFILSDNQVLVVFILLNCPPYRGQEERLGRIAQGES
jgi:hypothetical protein